jgi:hypothetical protein
MHQPRPTGQETPAKTRSTRGRRTTADVVRESLRTIISPSTPWIFLDPGANLGWAIASGSRGVYAAGRLVKGWDAVLALRLLQGLTLRTVTETPPIVVVEDQYVGSNAQSAMSVVESRMRIEVPAQLLHPQIPHVLRVLSTSWQGDMLRGIGKRTRDSLKAAAMESARKVIADFPQAPRVITEDMADAICGAHWVGSVAFGWAIP